MNKNITKRKGLKRKINSNEHKIKKHVRPKILYDKKLTVPLGEKKKSEYDAEEEARLEQIIFSDPSDVIDNLLDDHSETKVTNESVNIEYQKVTENDMDNADQDTVVSNSQKDAELEERKAVWVDSKLKKRKAALIRPKVLYNKKFSNPLRRKRKNKYNAEEEARLEKIVFGDPSDVINNLLDDHSDTKVINESVGTENKKVTENDKDNSDQDTVVSNNQKDAELEERKAVWEDDDDNNYTVNVVQQAQNRKLPFNRSEKLYTTCLENRYKLFVGTPKWAEFEKKDNTDDLDNDILKHSCHLEAPRIKNLPKNIIDIKALKALNKSTHTEGPIITSVDFHPSSTVALVAGTSGILSLFQVDGHTNEKLHSMQFKKYPISKAIFVKNGTEILLGSQYYPYCYTYDLMNDRTHKLPLPHGITNMKHYEISPDGKLIALCGRSGEIYLLHSCTKELITTFKMNSKCNTLTFSTDNRTLITHGKGSEMYVWDLNTRTCINRAIDDGCISCASLAISPSGQFIATGSTHGVVNLYNAKTVLEDQNPIPLKIMMNLVTSVTSLRFNPTSEILSVASVDKYNAFKMMHIPSFTIFSNFPTFQTKIGMPQMVNYSPSSGYLSIANRKGSALLYRLRHYENY